MLCLLLSGSVSVYVCCRGFHLLNCPEARQKELRILLRDPGHAGRTTHGLYGHLSDSQAHTDSQTD